MKLFVFEIVIEVCFVVLYVDGWVLECFEIVLCWYVELSLLWVEVLLVEVGISCC